MRNMTENQRISAIRASGVILMAVLAGLLLAAPMANASAESTTTPLSATSTATALDPISTGSIGTTLNQARTTMEAANHDPKNLSPVQIPPYLSILSDRRILVLLSLIGLAVVWINRNAHSRDDNKN